MLSKQKLNDNVYYKIVPGYTNVAGEPFLGELQLYNKYGDLLGKIYSDRSRTDWKHYANVFINDDEMAQLHAIADTLDEPLETLQERGERGRRLAKSFVDNLKNPTGIANPADYIGKVTIEKDTDNDGDIDTKITKTKDKDDDEDVVVEGSYW